MAGPRTGPAVADLLLHDIDSLPTVDSGEAGGDAWSPCRDNPRYRVVVVKKTRWRVAYAICERAISHRLCPAIISCPHLVLLLAV